MNAETHFDSDAIKIDSVDFRLRPRFRDAALSKASALFRRHSELLGLLVKLRRKETGNAVSEFSATVRLVLPGYDRVVVKRGNQLAAVIAEALEVADRQLRRRARALRASVRA